MMTEPFSPDGPQQILADLCRLAAERVPAEEAIAADFQERTESAEKAYQEAQEALTTRYREEKAAAEAEDAALRNTAIERFETEHATVLRQYEEARQDIAERFEDEKVAAEQEMQNAQWDASTIAEAAKGGSGVQLKEIQAQLESRWQELQTIHHQAVSLLNRWGQWRDFVDPQPVSMLLERHPVRRFCHALDMARTQYHALASQFMPRLVQGLRPMGIALLLWGVMTVPAGALLGWGNYDRWVMTSAATSFFLFVSVGVPVYLLARRRCADYYLALRRTMLEAGLDRSSTLEMAKGDCQRLLAAIDSRQVAEIGRANEKLFTAMGASLSQRERQTAEIEANYPPRLAAIQSARDQALQQADAKYPPLLSEVESRHLAQSAALRETCQRALAASKAQHEYQWNEMAQRWNAGVARFVEAVESIRKNCERLFPDWHAADAPSWTPPSEMPAAIRFGQINVQLSKIHGGIPEDPRLKLPATEFILPLLLPLPDHSLLLLKAGEAGRPKAIESIQASMLRLLTSIPPGKIRFTIFDPVGLGENFSAFMHLADFDEQLVSSRIWTDSDHIEQRLADLTQHMENVIQVYLRNEFDSILEYNAFAGEMAEPYRVLVIANFPANFTETAVQRLKSIVASGARCGVFVLLGVDSTLATPHNVRVSDLDSGALLLRSEKGQFVWKHPEYGTTPVTLDAPPPPERFTEIVRAVGHAVRDAGRVEVPFHCVIPTEDAWWTYDSRSGIDVPLGRAGAMKLQNLDLGRGTSQHVLISGKTGSGKSTLLHVLITNVALRYSPDEIELYLVDFKKGVEFKAYARYLLPHARVIAIESEREFGLSVLQRLDAELRSRGDQFRRLGVQDLKGFRNTQPDEKLARVLLMIDEFQELFVEDDRIAQESALLLDRLVRQGRAFGIHVLLGSQTLGGAYSLARSTIGQMAVRIALQCSEADAHLILSEDNTAARLLTRPGEAIYNDANGLFEGNHPFQIVWLSDDERDEYLRRLTEFSGRRNLRRPPPIVFEGNVPADQGENSELQASLAAAVWPESCTEPHFWLGSAVAIKGPTAAVFARQAGSNLLLAGHREEASLGVMATGLIGLAAQHAYVRQAFQPDIGDTGQAGKPDLRVRFRILDGTRPEAPEAGYWQRVVDVLPHDATVGGLREAPEVLRELFVELVHRQQEGQDGLPSIYFLIYNLGRFRDFRKEDDFSFGREDDKPATPGKMFCTILRDGPACGIHTIAWCDSYATVNRLLDRQSLRDFDLRVLFQMNATDSSSLMDSPDAARLGVHRAIFYDGGHGQMEKFRPYGLPSAAWLAEVRRQLFHRAER
ncbi:MAG: FtsK/SpoIIIE domain-containing protein [Planctomycetota bacterium]